MRKIISLSLTKDHLAQLDALAHLMGCSRSEAVRRLVEQAKQTLTQPEAL